MARNKVMTLWTALVTAFLALCTALGLITTTASAAVPQTEPTRNSESAPNATAPEPVPFVWSLLTALPPTMKQRIHAEAHGKSPSCRHRPPEDTPATTAPASEDTPATADPASEDTPATADPVPADTPATAGSAPADCSEATTQPTRSLPGDPPPSR
ncbi:secreted protein [Streptomyces viridosporus ATCC 14672]|uniref:Secreted protein n=1 Tax=Streptomyces viridosporus (strain ATCC 14672 / DSM 40746 / JCM 4963 / KCTC 9882 / NRRL B-12104 / FH 1290) TaxID=566461 RepID=D5ZQW8_STRV1|nr:DUF6344 domain-containing protein [Streptomyces viridosporus]EFE68359.1 secreted protein [Streptomyces viridosporus ATCC 14672]